MTASVTGKAVEEIIPLMRGSHRASSSAGNRSLSGITTSNRFSSMVKCSLGSQLVINIFFFIFVGFRSFVPYVSVGRGRLRAAGSQLAEYKDITIYRFTSGGMIVRCMSGTGRLKGTV